MFETAAPNALRNDLASRADVEALLRRFYSEAFRDELLAEPFAELRSHGLERHLSVMCDFWETVLFRAGLYRRNALHAHRRVHHLMPLSAQHFQRWLTLWTTTIDQLYQGPVAEHAKIQAARVGTALHNRLASARVPPSSQSGELSCPAGNGLDLTWRGA